MSWLTQGLLLLLLAAVCATLDDDGCLEGYKKFSSETCLMVTPPGTWLEAFSMCRLPDNSVDFDPIAFVEKNRGAIQSYLLQEQLSISTVWRYPSDYKSLNNEMAQNNISWENGLFYSYHVSRWKWLNGSTNECKTLTLSSTNQEERSCSPEGSNQKLPFLCVLPRRQFRTLTAFSTCTDEFEGIDESDECIYFDNKLSAYLLNKYQFKSYQQSSVFEHNFVCGDQPSQIIDRKELEKVIGEICYSEYDSHIWTHQNDYATSSDRLQFTLPEFFRNSGSLGRLKNKTLHDGPRRETRKVILGRRQIALSDDDTCVFCAQTSRLQTPSRRPGMTPSLSLQLSHGEPNRLTLKILNFVSNKTEKVSCYSDASLSSFTSPNYKIRTFAISPPNKQYVRSITMQRTIIEESFFLRLRSNSITKHTPMLEPEMEKEVGRYSNWQNRSLQYIEIPFEVMDEGNYWCVGRDYETQLPIFSERVLVEISSKQNYQRYLVLLEVPLKYDPIKIYCQKFSTIMARHLEVTDANIDLKRITSEGGLLKLLYHVTLRPAHPELRVLVPKSFLFRIGQTNVMAEITSIDKFSQTCPETTLSSSQGTFFYSPFGLLSKKNSFRVLMNGTETNGVDICVGDTVLGARWEEITREDPRWNKQLDHLISSRMESLAQEDLDLVGSTFFKIHNLSQKPTQPDQLPNVTDLVKVLLNRGIGSAPDNGKALEDIDVILSNINLTANEKGFVSDIRSSELAILVSNLRMKNPVIGISLTSEKGKDTINSINAEDRKISRESPSEKEEVFVYLPETITSRYTKLAFAVITNVTTFNSLKSPIRVNSRIVNIVLSGPEKIPDHTNLPNGEVVEIYLKPMNSSGSEARSCAYWDLQSGVWSEKGCTLNKATNICRCSHLTHFAQIITGAGRHLSEGHQQALEVISKVGCAISLIGLLVIVATGVVFKAWRQEIGNQVLLNLTAALTLNLVTYLLLDGRVGSSKGAGCIFIGVVMHYSVLACFCWMLVMSGLQVVRLLTLVGNRNTSKLLLKSSLFAWGVPVIPIAILLIIGPTTYTSSTKNSIDREFCYPTGAAFYATVLGPVMCIIAINVVAYITIMCRIFSCCGWGALKPGIERHGLSDGMIAVRRIRILVFLFFLFGLTWTFAFLARYVFFAYLFCITASLQGFVIFFFFFVIEKKSRGYWYAEFFQTSGKRNYKSSDTLTSVTYSTGTHKASESKTSGSKSSWYVENFPLLPSVEDTSSVRLRSKDGLVESSGRDKQPKPRISANGLTASGHFSEAYTDSPNKRVSFDVEKLKQNSGSPHIISSQATRDADDNGLENVKESPKLEPSVDMVEMPGREDVLPPDNIVENSSSVGSSSSESSLENPSGSPQPTHAISNPSGEIFPSHSSNEEMEVPEKTIIADDVDGNKTTDSPNQEEEQLQPKISELTTAIPSTFSKPDSVPKMNISCEVEMGSDSVTLQELPSQFTDAENSKVNNTMESVENQAVNSDVNLCPETFIVGSVSEVPSTCDTNLKDDKFLPEMNVSSVSLEPNLNKVGLASTSSEIKPTTQLTFIPNKTEETFSPKGSEEHNALAFAVNDHDEKVMEPLNFLPKKRSPFVVTCPITRH